jgi:hypothetical protein
MSAFDIARGWRVQRFGRKGPHEILDAIVEPLWDGPRVFVAVERGEAAVFHEGSRLNGPPDIVAQLAQAAAAGTALVAEGCLTQQALRNGEGAMLDSGEGTPSMRTRMFGTMGGGKRDALLREKEEKQRLDQRDAQVVSGEAGPLAFVATDLLWLDGDELLEVPLLERKRILESVLGEAELIRRSAFIRPSATGSILGWRSLGFQMLAYKSANGRYHPGEENDGWAAVPVPGSNMPITTGQR